MKNELQILSPATEFDYQEMLDNMYTEEETINALKVIKDTAFSIASQTQWALGDWYNAVKNGDKKRMCEKVGVNYKTAQECARIASKYTMPARAGIASYTCHREAAIITDEIKRDELLKRAAEKEWSSRYVKEKAKEIEYGPKPEPTAMDKADKAGKALAAALDDVVRKTHTVGQKLGQVGMQSTVVVEKYNLEERFIRAAKVLASCVYSLQKTGALEDDLLNGDNTKMIDLTTGEEK